jgi:hypothetical protein
MHYLIHDASFAIVEDAEQAHKYVEAGWQLVRRADVMVLWRARDRATLARMRAEARPVVLVAQAAGLPDGWKLYHV